MARQGDWDWLLDFSLDLLRPACIRTENQVWAQSWAYLMIRSYLSPRSTVMALLSNQIIRPPKMNQVLVQQTNSKDHCFIEILVLSIYSGSMISPAWIKVHICYVNVCIWIVDLPEKRKFNNTWFISHPWFPNLLTRNWVFLTSVIFHILYFHQATLVTYIFHILYFHQAPLVTYCYLQQIWTNISCVLNQ